MRVRTNSIGSPDAAKRYRIGGAKEDRTPDLLRARQALSQLSYGPRVTGLVLARLRCARLSFSHLLLSAPSFMPAHALPNDKNPA
jgi:hypothetical protein